MPTIRCCTTTITVITISSTNSFFLKNGSFVRLKNIELSYTLPENWSKVAGMSNCRLYVNANNLITWDHLNNQPIPESNGSNRYPIMKTVNFGVNIKFLTHMKKTILYSLLALTISTSVLTSCEDAFGSFLDKAAQ